MVNCIDVEEQIKKNSHASNEFKFTIDDWNTTNFVRNKCSKIQQHVAQQLIEKANNLCESTTNKVTSNKNETNHQLKSRINEIEKFKQELISNRNELPLEIDTLINYCDRLKTFLIALKKNAEINKKCLAARGYRIGIDLVIDEVELELKKEQEAIKCVNCLIEDTLEKAEDQIRQLKSALYFMDRDLEDKENNLRIDRYNSTLKETNLNLSIYVGKEGLSLSYITNEEWKLQTKNNIENCKKVVLNARKMITSIDNILRQSISDLNIRKKITDEVLRKRIEDTKDVKTKLELEHSKVMYKTNEMTKNITKLEKVIAEKEGFIALVHTRLGNRCQRPGLESVYDDVEKSLIKEISDLREVVSELQLTLFEAQVSLRSLFKIQIQLQEDINVKTNSLNIDEVFCLTTRQSIDYHSI